ncbi:MAG: hypothetical protein NUV77_23130 [Thermoguttaceae bacterium]|jgi:hypothetical protein|nr:hypothetical protein [Thermoguttaceae bacterium]
MFRDLRRLFSLLDALNYLGNLLYKRSVRYTGVSAAMSIVGYLANYLPGTATYSARVAMALPVLVGSTALLGGLLLKSIPSLIAKRMANVAEAQDLDLMEDYRKSCEDLHLLTLWDRVFCYEWQLGSTATTLCVDPAEAPEAICRPRLSGQSPGELGRAEFLARARFALARPQPQPRQRYHLGIDLRFFEDWRNGACFDRNDTKLLEQYEASATLEAIRREVGHTRWESLGDLPLRMSQKFWLFLTSRAMAIAVGEAVSQLNRAYDTDWFNAQALLWPGEEAQPWLDRFPGAASEVRRLREAILDRVYGADPRVARRMLERTVLPSFVLATRLRVRFDPEYAEGSLGYSPAQDLAQVGLSDARLDPYRRVAAEVGEERAWLSACLARYRPELLAADHAEAYRAVRVAVHARRRGFRPLVARQAEGADPEGRFSAVCLPVIDRAAARYPVYTARLTAMRLHHELARLHFAEYAALLEMLRQTPAPEVGRMAA